MHWSCNQNLDMKGTGLLTRIPLPTQGKALPKKHILLRRTRRQSERLRRMGIEIYQHINSKFIVKVTFTIIFSILLH